MSDGDGVTFSPETQPEQLAERGGEAAASGSADESVQVSERVLAANLQRQGWLSDADLDRARSLQSRRLPQILRDGRLLDEEALAALEREVDAAHPGITDTERDVALAKLLRDRDLVDPDALANAQSLLDRPLEEVIVSLGLVEAESLRKLKRKVAKARAKRKRAEQEAAERTGPEAADQPPSGDSNPSGLGSGLGSPEAADPGGSIAGGVEALDEADEADASGEHAATSPAANGKRAGAQDAGQQPEMMRVPHDCGFVVKAPLDWGGRQGNCPKCGKPVRMPTLKQWRAQQQAIAEAQQMAQSYEAAELGAILVADGLISQETLQKAINVQAHEFGQMLVAQELLDEPTLREAERLSKELAQCNPAERKQRLEQIREDAKHDSQAGMAAFQQGDTPMIRVACPQCNFVVKGPEDWAGKSGQCPTRSPCPARGRSRPAARSPRRWRRRISGRSFWPATSSRRRRCSRPASFNPADSARS